MNLSVMDPSVMDLSVMDLSVMDPCLSGLPIFAYICGLCGQNDRPSDQHMKVHTDQSID